MVHYFVVNKPYGVLSQFTREAPYHRTLGDMHDFPSTVYPVGRLDRDSEGLLILTDDKRLNTWLLDPSQGHRRTYWVRVEGAVGEGALSALRRGPEIRIRKKIHRSAPVRARVFTPAPAPAPRKPPVRYRKTVPDSWLELELTEGKNRQVRRMCAAVGHPVLRLIRFGIEDLTLEVMNDREVHNMNRDRLFRLLRL